jgi:SAM-dependent methyltransferase
MSGRADGAACGPPKSEGHDLMELSTPPALKSNTPVLMRVVSPEWLPSDRISFMMEGWYTYQGPDHTVAIFFMDGRQLSSDFSTPELRRNLYLHSETVLFSCTIDLHELVKVPLLEWVEDGVSFAFDIVVGVESGRVEYEVSQGLIEALFGKDSGLVPKIFPPPHLQMRVAGVTGVNFGSFGDLAIRRIVKRLEDCGVQIQGIRTALDLGSGPGRLARILKRLYPHMDLTCSDIDPETIEWATHHIGSIDKFVVNSILPPLEYPDDHFELIYTVSTFTHMPESLQFAWLDELRRVLKPGGCLLATIHGPKMVDYITSLHPATFDLGREIAKQGFVYVDEAREGWPSYFGTITDGLPSFYKLSYHSHDYIKKTWSRFFDVISINEMDLNIFQDSVVLQKRKGDTSNSLESLQLREAAARVVLEDANAEIARQSKKYNELLELWTKTDRALGEAQRIAYEHLQRFQETHKLWVETDRALSEAQTITARYSARISELEGSSSSSRAQTAP